MRVGFGRYVLDTATRLFTRDATALHLSPKAFQLLAQLVDARPAVVDRASLRQRLWPDTHVVDAALGNLIAEIRNALGADATLVRTVHGVGYAFAGTAQDLTTTTSPATPRYGLTWNERTIVLDHPASVIGRDPTCAVWIDAPGVSRRHACIHLPATGDERTAVIEDLGSTNGTDVNAEPVSSPRELADGDTVTLGDATLTFRAWHHADAPTRRVRRPRSG